ncbi:MAG: hypothetical protein QOE45_536 [Frankiaceae bacterium]|nr:hypothetical protein [Frankiaceae bacterium]
MRVRPRPALGLAAATLAALAVAALSAPQGALPTSESRLGDKSVVKSFPVYDARGKRAGSAKWRLTKAGGNCCEVLVTATRTGRLIEFGGTYPIYSDDQGRTWTEVAPAVPSTSRLPDGDLILAGGEGTVVQAPGGDILGIGWDPYSGDRLQSFYYSAQDKKWYYQEAPLHEPFYDREWVAVAKGPFTINGATFPWVALVLSNSNRKAVLMSTDGLNYFTPTQRDLDAVRNAPVNAYLPTQPDPDLDYMQEQAQTGLAGLSRGALSFDRTQTCKTQLLTSNGSWSCFTLPNEHEITGPLHTDSRGWLHEVVTEGGDVTYRLSRNGGRTWTERTFTFPGEPVIETYDFKTNGKLGLTVVAAHADTDDGDPKSHVFQDMVMRIDTRSGTPRLEKTYFVGAGNMSSTVGLDATAVSSNARVDFTSVAILPDGTIAVSFADREYADPAVAILTR